MDLLQRALLGVLASSAIAALAHRRGSLAPSGATAAVAVGATIFVGGGPTWFAALMFFFVTSSALGRVGRARKERTKREFSKDDRRDALQVLANGGAAAVCAAAYAHTSDRLWAACFLGALATANGDTWATELGVLSRAEPWSLRTLRRVPRGESGGVSPLGSLATAAGAVAIGAVACAHPAAFSLPEEALLLSAGLGGLTGAFFDSFVGAMWQAQYHCPRCAHDTEGRVHHCGAHTQHSRGLSWLDNDLVNFSATCVGAASAALLVALI